MLRRVLFLLLLTQTVFLSSCLDAPVLPGTVARVNGQDVFFSDLEARRVSLFAGSSESSGKPDDVALTAQYRYALGQLIGEALICQYMREQKRSLDEKALAAEELRIRGDYPDGAFDQMMLERGMSLERWRADTARGMLVELFMAQVLRPGITISADEVQAYYKEHSDEFTISEQWHFFHVGAENKEEAERALARLGKGEDAETVQKDLFVTIRDVRMGLELLPEHIHKALRSLKPGQASRVTDGEEGYWAVRLIEVWPASALDAAEISKRVELALSEEKMRAIYGAWMKKQLETAEIRITPILSGRGEEAASGPEPAFPPGRDAGLPPPLPAGGPAGQGG